MLCLGNRMSVSKISPALARFRAASSLLGKSLPDHCEGPVSTILHDTRMDILKGNVALIEVVDRKFLRNSIDHDKIKIVMSFETFGGFLITDLECEDVSDDVQEYQRITTDYLMF